MAPIFGLKRADLIRLLEHDALDKALPIQLSWMGPAGIVQNEDGRWTLRALRCNDAQAEAEHQKRIADGDDAWTPEDTWPFYQPAEVLVQASSKEEFIQRIVDMDWPFTPDDFDPGDRAPSPLQRLMRLLRSD